MYIFIFAWIISPFILIPMTVKRSKENSKMKGFIDSLLRSGRISTSEYVRLEAETEKQSAPQSSTASEPVFADSREFSKVRGGNSVRAAESNAETGKGLYDLPVYAYQKTPSAAEPAPKKSENKADSEVRHVVPPIAKPVEKAAYEIPKQAPEKNKTEAVFAGKKKAAAMSVLMMIGIIFVILAGLVFSTAVWATLGVAGRTLAVGMVSALFFGVSAFIGKKVKLERTSFAFYILGTFFSAITLITAGFFGLTGSWFSVTGEGRYLLYAAALLIITLFTAKGRSIFDMSASAYISAFSGTLSAVLILVQLSENIGIFALLAAIITAVINIFMNVLDLKISDKWEKPLRTSASLLNAAALVGGIGAAFGGTIAFYAAAAVFVLRSIVAAVMGFMGRRVYKTSLAAVTSLASGAFFALLIMSKLSGSTQIFALSAAIFAVIFAFGMLAFNIKIPEGWEVPIKMSAFILNAVGIISSLYALMRNFGEWDGVCFAVAAVYILSSFTAGIMAVCGHERYSEAPSAFASMFTGLAFSVLLVAELSASGEIAALCFTIMLIVLVNVLYTLPSKLPEGWEIAAGISAAVLGLISFFGTLLALVDNFGEWDASCVTLAALYILQSVIITAAAYLGHGEYSKGGWAVLSQLAGIFFTVLSIAQLAESEISFMLYLTAFAAAYLNFAYTFKLKKPAGWEVPLKIFSYLLGVFGVIFTAAQMLGNSEWTYHFYVTIAIYIAYSAAVTAMAFFGHKEYSKTPWAVISQITGIAFSLSLIYKSVPSAELFVLFFAAFAVLYSAAAYLAFMKTPENWVKAINVTDIIFNIAAAVSAAIMLLSDFGYWDVYCFLTALLYIGYAAVRGVLRQNAFLKAAESVLSSIAAYNLYLVMYDENFAAAEFWLVCIMFALAVAHHFAKPLRTLFSDIFLTAGLAVSAVFCAVEYNLFGVLGFVLLGIVMLIKSAEVDKKRSSVFKALLPLPVTGAVLTFVYGSLSEQFGNMAAANAVVLALTAAAIMFLRKKSDITFYSFGFAASLFIFMGTASEFAAVQIILLMTSVLLTVLFCRRGNNLPSLLSMAGTAAVVYRLEDMASLHADFNVSLLFAAVFAAVCLVASRVFYGKKVLDRGEGRLHLDTCCLEMLLALPMIHSADERVTAFAVLTILAAFAANLARKEHSGDANRAALTIACGLFSTALIFRPFLIVSDELVSRKITLGIIALFGFAFSKIWANRPNLAENFSSAVYGIAFVCLIIDALSHQNLVNTLIVLIVSALILLYSFISKKKRWFAVSSVSLLGLTLYTFRDFFAMIDWWVYLLIVGLILIAVSAANEYFVRKGREFREKAGRFFEDWKW